jgi:exodeoxyribonuclease I
MDVVRAAWSLRPEGLQWPRHEDGRPSFKLEHMTAANGLAHEAAHDALSDVRATIALARLIRQAQPRLWDFCLQLRDKNAVWKEIGHQRPFAHVSGMYPADRGCLAIVWPLAPHPTNKNELIVWDLAQDPSELERLSLDEARLRLFTRTADLPEGVTRLPVKSIHVNKSPVVFGNLKALGAAAQRWQIDVDLAWRHAERAQALGGRLDGLWAELYQRPAPDRRPDVDEDLYGGFVGNADRALLQRARRMSPQDLADHHPLFSDPRLEELFFRYRARNFPGTLGDEDRARWQDHCAGRFQAVIGPWHERIDELFETADERGQALLDDLLAYAESLAP